MTGGPSILKRFIHTFGHVISGCLFFYVVLVLMSYYSKGTTLDLLPYNAWSRMASRATGAAAVFPYVLQLVVSPASMWSLFAATWTCCAFAVHMMIVATDTKILEDPSYHAELVRQGGRPLLSYIPRKLAIGLGLLGYVGMVFCGLERTYGGALGNRRTRYPVAVQVSLTYISSVYMAWFADRLTDAVLNKKDAEEIAYPIAFLSLVALATAAMLKRNCVMCSGGATAKGKTACAKESKTIVEDEAKKPLVDASVDEDEDDGSKDTELKKNE